MNPPNILKSLLLLFFSIIFSLVLVFVIGEAYFRISFDAKVSGPPTDWFMPHEARGYSLVPGDYAYVDIAAFRDVQVHIDELGIRHDLKSLSVPEGKRRITLVGDSFVFGAALNGEETIAAQIESQAGQEYEVVSVAVPGYGTGLQILFLEEMLDLGYEIGDHLVFVFFTNDMLDDLGLAYDTMKPISHKPSFSVDPNGNLQHTTPANPWQSRKQNNGNQDNQLTSEMLFPRFLMYQAEMLATMFPSILRYAHAMGLEPRLPRRPGIINAWYEEGWIDRWGKGAQVVHWLAGKHGQSDEYKLSFAFIPSPFQVVPTFKEMLNRQGSKDPTVTEFLGDIERPQKKYREVADRWGIDFIDTTRELRRSQEDYPVYFAREGHVNTFGASVVANTIYEALFDVDRPRKASR